MTHKSGKVSEGRWGVLGLHARPNPHHFSPNPPFLVCFADKGRTLKVMSSNTAPVRVAVAEADANGEGEVPSDEEDLSQAETDAPRTLVKFKADAPGQPSVTKWAFKMQVLFRLKTKATLRKRSSAEEPSDPAVPAAGGGLELSGSVRRLTSKTLSSPGSTNRTTATAWNPILSSVTAKRVFGSGRRASSAVEVSTQDGEADGDQGMSRLANAINLMRYIAVSSQVSTRCVCVWGGGGGGAPRGAPPPPPPPPCLQWTRLAVARRALYGARTGDVPSLLKSIGNYKRNLFLNNGRPLNLLNAAIRNGHVHVVSELLARFSDLSVNSLNRLGTPSYFMAVIPPARQNAQVHVANSV